MRFQLLLCLFLVPLLCNCQYTTRSIDVLVDAIQVLGEPVDKLVSKIQDLSKEFGGTPEVLRSYRRLRLVLPAREHQAFIYHREATFLAFDSKISEAVSSLRNAIELDETNMQYHYDLGVLLHLLQHLPDAEVEYSHAVRLGSVAALAHLAKCQAEQQHYSEAIGTYYHLVQHESKGDHHHSIGVLFSLQHDYAQAERHFAEALRLGFNSATDLAAVRGILGHPAPLPSTPPAASHLPYDLPPEPPLQQRNGVSLWELHTPVSHDVDVVEPTEGPVDYHQLGLAFSDRGDYVRAIRYFRKAREAHPGETAPDINMALTYTKMGMEDYALQILHIVLQHDPTNAVAMFNYGNIMLERGDLSQALYYLQGALEQLPQSSVIRSGFGRWFMAQARWEEAASHFSAALQLDPQLAGTWVNLGICLKEQQFLQEARESYEKAIELTPNDPIPWYNLGSVFKDGFKFKEALYAYQVALSLQPDFPEAFCEMYHSMIWTCNWDNYTDFGNRFTYFVQRTPLDRLARLMQPFYALVLPVPLSMVKPAATAYCLKIQRQMSNIRMEHQHPTQLVGGKLRLGYVSSDYRKHAVGRQISTLLKYHRSMFESWAYSTEKGDDSQWGKAIRAAATQVTEMLDTPPLEFAQRLQSDSIHIAINLNGHTKGARTDVFSLRPAPIIVNFLGYPSTMGGDFTDYIVTDRISSPPVYRHAYSEHLVYMPHSYQVNEHKGTYPEPHKTEKPSRASLGLPENAIVFTSFNQLFRIDPYTFDVWMRLLRRLPGSVLWILHMPDDGVASIYEQAVKRGVERERIVFVNMTTKPEHIKRILNADMMLDSPVYNGHTTCGDALWAGVPVVTLPGEKMPSRVAAAMMHALGVTETIARSLDEYEEIAYRLAVDSEYRTRVRQRIHNGRMMQPLFDMPLWMRNWERALEMMWDLYEVGLPVQHVIVHAVQ